ncbi:MAG: hypothetical protein D6798_12585 [Deltaproteobacteria bacterium]|nr:MAG: hypothetical protein D6798_12585 [Deltaproteobacteria bacterium]
MIPVLPLLGCTAAPVAPTADMVHVAADPVTRTPSESGYFIDRYEFPNQAGVQPEVYVDLETAARRCAEVGKRLCTAAEWRLACQGIDGSRRYGYGPRHVRGRCHTEDRLSSGHTSMMDPTTLVAGSGRFPDCHTPEGVYDLVGNAEEWVLDDWRGVGGMLEGGAWYTWAGYADCTGTYSREPDYRLSPDRAVFSAGFRCCWSEAAPTAADLTPEQVRADAEARLAEARAASSPAPYNPDDEVEVAPGLFMDVFEYPNRPGEFPRTAVTWTEARDLCAAAGKRLCTASEWERACAGPAGFELPYGDRYVEGACAIHTDSRPRSGQAYACASAAGVQDLVGSAWEWTSTRLDARALESRPGEVLREIRGGSWHTDPVKGVCRPDDGYPAAPQDIPFPDLGFRCCRGEAIADPVVARPGDLACPPDMVAVAGTADTPDLCIDRYEEPDRPGAMPTTHLTLDRARDLCARRGRHLCTEAEWMAACAGAAGRRWPYGDEYVAGRCQDSGDAGPGEGGTAVPSGSREGCATPEGVMDMSGNLWEWTVAEDGQGVLHGGGWNLSAGLNQCRARARAEPTEARPQFGARCCATAQEAAALLGAGGGAP